MLRYESGDELGVVSQKLKEALIHLSGYAQEIFDELKRMAAGDLGRGSRKMLRCGCRPDWQSRSRQCKVCGQYKRTHS